MGRKSILITGGFGFIGSNLAKKALEKDFSVTLLSKSDKRLKNIKGIEDKVQIIYKNVKDIENEVEGKDYIFHLASTVDNYNINSDPYLDIDINCNGTIALLEACRKHNPLARIVLASTFFVNGNLDKLPANPQSPCNPMGLYPATRLAAEHFCKIYNQVFNLNSVIARFTNVFGVNEESTNKKKAAFNYLIKLATEDKGVPVYGDGGFKRDYIYVDDVSKALLTIADKGEKGEIYYVGRGEGVKFIDLMNIIIEEAGKGKIEYMSPPEFHNKVGIVNYFADISPLRKLGWEPEISIREGIRRTIKSYKNE
jgi:UDP-glucose 4-epimerase